ncbi:MAG TPA: hypothetical protein VGD77_07120 [Gemmatimonadaceae bacterium]
MNRHPLLLLLLAACARSATPPGSVVPQGSAGAPTAATAAERQRRCAELADSTSRVAIRLLPRANNANPGRLEAYPRDLRDGGTARATYRIRPDGSGEALSLVITGSNDADFRRALERGIEQMRARPAMREGCPVWSQGEYMIKAKVVGRVRG